MQNSTNITTKMRYEQLYRNILAKKSFLCVGLDPDLQKMPSFLASRDNPIYEFNREIILHTAPYTVAYKLNTAFYEAYGVKGWQELNMTVEFIREKYPDLLIIADADRSPNEVLEYSIIEKIFINTIPQPLFSEGLLIP